MEEESYVLSPCDDTVKYFNKLLSESEKTKYHQIADYFCFESLINITKQLGIVLPDDCKTTRLIFTSPNGIIDKVIHTPTNRNLFINFLNIAVIWGDHLFFLKEYQSASNIINTICYSLAREGYRELAKNLLFRLIPVTDRNESIICRLNLATLMREDSFYAQALEIYKKSIIDVVRQKNWKNLGIIFSEMGVIYRQTNKIHRSILFLEFASFLQRLLRNEKSLAISQTQLASSYQYFRFYGLALSASDKAVNSFRKSQDFLNLQKSLLTQANIYLNLRNPSRAFERYDEALLIARQISDNKVIASCLSGKARTHIFQKNYQSAKQYLDEAISIKKRTMDHTIGVEYQNLGFYYESIKNYPLSLTWYKKALEMNLKYSPVDIPLCKVCIKRVESKILVSK